MGQPFDPWHKACGFYPPDIVGRDTSLKLTDGQKRLYERGVRWAGQKGAFWYAFDTIAEALGKSVRQVKDDMATLEEKRLIEHTRRRRQSNVYHFLWHPIFEVQSTAHQGGSLKVQDLTLEVQDSVKNGPLKVQPTARESCPSLNLVKESSSEAADLPPESQPVEANDDEPPFSQKTKTPHPAAATPFPATALPLEAPPVLAADAVAAPTTAKPNLEDREALVETARDLLQMARAAGMSFAGVISRETLAQVRRPDRAITEAILGAFRDYADFTTWLDGTVSRGVARKAKDTRWGLYLSDAKNHAEDVALQREAAEKRRIDGEIERERRQAEARAAVAELDQPMPVLQAFGKIQYRVHSAGRDIPPPLKARLKRTGEWISPNELARQILGWKRCAQCGDSGTVGNAIDKTLGFCGCPAGEEAPYSKGADWPVREMALVHADAKSLLVAACHAVGYPFTADAITDCRVSDAGGVLEIRLPDGHFGIGQSDVRKAAERLKWQRRIVITGGRQQPQPASAAKPEPAAPARPPITQADIDAELAKRRQKIPPQMEAGCDLAARAAAGGIQ